MKQPTEFILRNWGCLPVWNMNSTDTVTHLIFVQEHRLLTVLSPTCWERKTWRGEGETLLTQKTPCNRSTSAFIMWCYIFSRAPCTNHPHPHLLKPAPRWPSHLPAGWSVQLIPWRGLLGHANVWRLYATLTFFPRMLTNTRLEFCGLNPDQLY